MRLDAYAHSSRLAVASVRYGPGLACIGVTVRVETDDTGSGTVWTVLLDRPGARNAVDGPTAQALADAFRDFEASDAAVAVLAGAGGTAARSV